MATHPSVPSFDARLPALDVFRGLAALTIVLHHLVACVSDPRIGSPLAYLSRALSLGWVAVDAFFVLSGFLIGAMLLRDRGGPRYYSGFYLRRACRVLPLYFVLLLLYFVLRETAPGLVIRSDTASDPIPLWSFWCFAQNLLMAAHDTIGNSNLGLTWSLAVEEQFYLFIPLLVAVCPLRVLPWILAGGIVSAIVLRGMTGGITAYVLLPTRMDALLAGVLLAVASVNPASRAWMRAHRRALLLAAALLGAAGAGWLMLTRQEISGLESKLSGSIMIWAWLTALLILATLISSDPETGNRRPSPVFSALRWIGLRAYGIYLLHPWAQGIVFRLAGEDRARLTETQGWLPTLGALLLTALLAEASYRWLETPAMSYGRGLLRRPAPGSKPALAV